MISNLKTAYYIFQSQEKFILSAEHLNNVFEENTPWQTWINYLNWQIVQHHIDMRQFDARMRYQL